MLLDIKLEKTREMMCEEAVLASVALWMKRRYEMIFSQMWKFKLAEEDMMVHGVVGSRILIEDGDPKQLLEQYHGIRVTEHDIYYPKEILNIAHKELKAGLPTKTVLKGEYVPWALKGDEYIIVLVIGINYDNKEVICLDVHNLNQTAFLPLDNFLKGCGDYGCSTYSIVQDEQMNVDWISIIKHNMEYLLENNAFESMRELARLMRDSFDYAAENKEGKDAFSTEISQNFQKIYRTRFLFSNALEYLINFQKVHALSGYPDTFIKLSNKWLSVWSLLNKALLKQKFDTEIEKTSQKIIEAVDFEENIYDALLQSIEGSNSVKLNVLNSKNMLNPDKQVNEVVFVDISSYLNNDGFASCMHSESTADLTHTGQFFLTEGLPEEELWDVERVKFRFPHPMDGMNDNISCTGQTISFLKDNYSFVILLGCAEWGHQSEMMSICYVGERADSIPLEISDWSANEPLFGEVVAWEGKCAERTNSDISLIPWFKAHLFAKIIQLDNKLQLDSISLPECSNIHIFAITLGKSE